MNFNTIKNIINAKKIPAPTPPGRGSIVVENSFCKLQGFKDSTLTLITDLLTYENQEVLYELAQIKIQMGMAFRYRNMKKIGWYKQRIKALEAETTICWLKDHSFPTGHLNLVTALLDESKISYTLKDTRENLAKPVHYKWATKMNEPRYFQNEMLDIGLKAHRGVFVSAVGSGKTYVSQLLVFNLKVPALIILPSKDLSIQTYQSYVEAFGEKNVEMVDTNAKRNTKKPIRIATIHMMATLLKREQLQHLLDGVGMLIIDEVHHAGAKSYTELLPYFDHIYYRFGFSGTFLRNDSKTLDMWGFLSTVLYSYGAAQATKEGFLTPLKVLVHTIEGLQGRDYQKEYTVNYCANPIMMDRIASIVKYETSPDDQILILVGRKEQSGEVIHEMLNELGVPNEYVSGDSDRADVHKALKNFNNKKIKVLIGSSIIGEGIDIKSTTHLIMAQGGKSEIAITQAIGRAVRLFPGKTEAYVHDFKFENTRYLEKHLETRLDIYLKNFDAELIS